MVITPAHVFAVRPALPASIRGLQDLASNLWWSWRPAAQDLFRRIDVDSWHGSHQSPLAVLAQAPPERLAALAEDPAYVTALRDVQADFQRYIHSPTWFEGAAATDAAARIAYFSMEYGIAESVPLYSGGLGVLAGDHLKAASDLGVPIVGVGMLYRQGYFRQWIDSDGQQRERFPENDLAELPVTAQLDAHGRPLVVRVRITDREVAARLWRMDIGRTPLVLLDANLAENAEADRELTLKLYQGDSDVRLRQEILLGVGGVRALQMVGLAPSVTHMNEGHSAFLVLERWHELRAATGLPPEAVWELVRATSAFTTHTPVAAGHDEFSAEQIERHLGGYLNEIDLSVDDLMALGRTDSDDREAPFGVTQLALRGALWVNGVSALHGQVSRRMWAKLWPEVPVDEVPITHVTNGVHLRTWVAPELAELFGRHIGPAWAEHASADEIAAGIAAIPDAELWAVHVRCRAHLVNGVRRRLRLQVARRWGSVDELRDAEAVLQEDALTIGFARRFAVYKRPTLLLHDLERLRALLTQAARPLQIIFAGKAHPRDEAAKALVREIVALGHDPDLHGRVVFVEDYDMSLARDLVQGCDVWLNNPVRPQEASGTSGMKAAANGVLNVSVLDGWWAEGYRPDAGWAIGASEPDPDAPPDDRADAAAIHHLLERAVAPLFFSTEGAAHPAGWIGKAKAAMVLALTRFGTNRMVREYAERVYVPAHALGSRLARDGGAAAAVKAAWLARLEEQWGEVAIDRVEVRDGDDPEVGAEVTVRARVRLNGLDPADVRVQAYLGPVRQHGSLDSGRVVDAQVVGTDDGGTWFEASVRFDRSGRVGLAMRVIPRHADLAVAHETGLVRWSRPASPA